MESVCAEYRFALPPFCSFTPDEWESKGSEYDEIRDCMLGWDVTDFGSDDFENMGAALLTIRNGKLDAKDKYPKVYAEKLIYMKEGQILPNHFHWYKTEDIINRGGGDLLIKVWNSNGAEEVDRESDVIVFCDGRKFTVPAGSYVRLTPGESIYIPRGLYHSFEIEGGAVLIGEVSQCNDDETDNRFEPPVGRFPVIDEDEPPYRLLCNEYPEAK